MPNTHIAVDLIYNHPSDVGEIKDGRQWKIEHHRRMKVAKEYEAAPAPVKKLVKSREFVIIAIMISCNRIVLSAGAAYLTIHAIILGFSVTEAAMFLAIFNGVSLAGRFAPVMLSGCTLRIHISNAFGYVIMGIGAVLVAVAAQSVFYIMGCALLGFGSGYTHSIFSISMPEYFGNANFSAVFSMQSTIGYLDGVFSPTIFMMIAWFMTNYWLGYIIIALLSFLCALLSVITPADPGHFVNKCSFLKER